MGFFSGNAFYEYARYKNGMIYWVLLGEISSRLAKGLQKIDPQESELNGRKRKIPGSACSPKIRNCRGNRFYNRSA